MIAVAVLNKISNYSCYCFYIIIVPIIIVTIRTGGKTWSW